VTGRWTPSPGAEQSFELQAESVRVLGNNDAAVSTSEAYENITNLKLTIHFPVNLDIAFAKEISNT